MPKCSTCKYQEAEYHITMCPPDYFCKKSHLQIWYNQKACEEYKKDPKKVKLKKSIKKHRKSLEKLSE